MDRKTMINNLKVYAALCRADERDGRDISYLLLHPDTVEAAIEELGRRVTAKWTSPAEAMPEAHVPVIVARVYAADEPLKVEQAHYVDNGWWKVFGTRIRTKTVAGWMPMPEPPEAGHGMAD